MAEDEQLEALRKKRMLELQERLNQEQQQIQMQQQVDIQKQSLLRRILSPNARQRLANLKMIKPQFVAQIELQLIQLAQNGRIGIPLSDDRLKEILANLTAHRRDIKIRRK